MTIVATDQYGNPLTAGGETSWVLLIKTIPPEFLGQSTAGSVYDWGNGTYSGTYYAKANGVMLLQV